MKDIKSPYIDLAFAICIRAVEDYRASRCFLDKTPDDPNAKQWLKDRRNRMAKALIDTESFFNSDMFYVYSGLDGRKVFKQLKTECDDGYYGESRKRWA